MGQVLMFAALFFVVARLAENWTRIASDVSQLTAIPLLEAVLLTLTMLVLMPFGWTYALRASGADIGFQAGFSIYYRVSIFHYLPGSIWYLPGRALLCQKQGVSVLEFSRSILLEMLFLLASGGILAGWGLATYLGQPIILVLCVLAAGAAIITILWPVFVLSGAGRLPCPAKVDRRLLLAMFLVYMAVWFAYGGAIAILLQALANVPTPPVVQVVAVNSAAWLAGFLSLAPTGMGVREVSLATILGLDLGTAALVASLAQRVMEVCLELILWIIARWMQ